jgi:hypothetical protein
VAVREGVQPGDLYPGNSPGGKGGCPDGNTGPLFWNTPVLMLVGKIMFSVWIVGVLGRTVKRRREITTSAAGTAKERVGRGRASGCRGPDTEEPSYQEVERLYGTRIPAGVQLYSANHEGETI